MSCRTRHSVCAVTVGLVLGVVCSSMLYTSFHQPFAKQTLSQITRHFTGGAPRTVEDSCPSDLVKHPSKRDLTFANLSSARLLTHPDFDKMIYSEKIVILTPISNSGSHLHQYFSNICSLTYPHELISVILGEDSSQDNTYSQATFFASRARSTFRRVDVIQLPSIKPIHKVNRHEMGFQKVRRSHLAKSRNRLIQAGLQDESWVLWLDSDVRYIPRDIIERMLSAKKEIVVPACMYLSSTSQVYDKNTWKETPRSLQYLKGKGDKFLMVEGYSPPMRLYLDKLRHGEDVVEIDGVGGCLLLVKADYHREGLSFPTFVFDNHIETEGLAKMAQRMGYKLYGMPYVEVYHS